MGIRGQCHAPAALPPGKTWYSLYSRLGGPQGQSRQVQKISPPPEFDPQTVQRVVICYTDWAILTNTLTVATFLYWDPFWKKVCSIFAINVASILTIFRYWRCKTMLLMVWYVLVLSNWNKRILFRWFWKRIQLKLSGTVYTGCPKRNVPDFGGVFLMLKYTDITQNTYIQSWTVTEIMAREKCGLLAVPNTATCTADVSRESVDDLESGM